MWKCMTEWVGKDNFVEDTVIPLTIYWYWWSIVKDEQRTTSAWSVDLLHICHRNATEQYKIESSCIDLNNAVVVWNMSKKSKKQSMIKSLKSMAQDLYWYQECEYSWSEYEYEYEYLPVEYEYQYSSTCVYPQNTTRSMPTNSLL